MAFHEQNMLILNNTKKNKVLICRSTKTTNSSTITTTTYKYNISKVNRNTQYLYMWTVRRERFAWHGRHSNHRVHERDDRCMKEMAGTRKLAKTKTKKQKQQKSSSQRNHGSSRLIRCYVHARATQSHTGKLCDFLLFLYAQLVGVGVSAIGISLLNVLNVRRWHICEWVS